MSNNAINAKDSTDVGCTNPSDITAETCGTQRSLHTADIKGNALLCEILTCLGEIKEGPLTKVVDNIVSATCLVKATSATNVDVASPDTAVNATVYGIATTAAASNTETEVITFGEYEDSSFTYTVNTPLFLGPTGKVTDVPPTTGVLTQIGYSLGNGKIFINIQDPICL